MIPSIHKHRPFLGELCIELIKQMRPGVEVLIDEREGLTTGQKRNDLIAMATGIYTTFVDADDSIAPDYIMQILNAASDAHIMETKAGNIWYGPEAIVFTGIITTNGKNPVKFRLSKDYPYETVNGEYLRPPNHIVPIRRDISSQFKFPHTSYGEDYAWCMQIVNSGLIKTEVKIEKDLYFYKYISKPR